MGKSLKSKVIPSLEFFSTVIILRGCGNTQVGDLQSGVFHQFGSVSLKPTKLCFETDSVNQTIAGWNNNRMSIS